jgi:hypothetical protein
VEKTFLPHDAAHILDIKIPAHSCKDMPAWNYEKSGIFSVRSAYKLAYNLAHTGSTSQGNSATRYANRSLWKGVWSAPVPNKVKIFGWRLASNNLATQENNWRRTLETQNIFQICGTDKENSFHATVSCTKAKAIRHKMRKYWNLPREEEYRDTGKDWLLILLSKQRKKEQGQILLLLWRAWHLRNNIIHGDGKESIKHSVEFLLNYARELDQNSSGNDQFTDVVETSRPKTFKTWKKPEPGSIKVNVDASFISSDGQASVGVVARNEKGGDPFFCCKVFAQLQLGGRS